MIAANPMGQRRFTTPEALAKFTATEKKARQTPGAARGGHAADGRR
jgi:hypothetical protein